MTIRRRYVAVASVAAAAALAAVPASAAAPQSGSLDTSWGSPNGWIVSNAGTYPGVQGLARQSDKVVAVGGDITSRNGDFVVARFNNDGSPDTSFGGTGVVKTDFAGRSDLASAVTVSGDKIVVAGYTCTLGFTNCKFALVRYNSNGSVDLQVSTQFPGGLDDEADAVVVKGNKIVLAGFADGNFGLVRYNDNGSVDTTFGNQGFVTTDFDGGFDAANSVAFAGDDIVAAGYVNFFSGNTNFGVARYTKNGLPDTSFNGTGKVETDFEGRDDAGHALDIKGGRILVVGEATVSGHSQLAAVMYLRDGSLDSTFGSGGKTSMDVGSDARGFGGSFGPGNTVIADGQTCFSCFPSGNMFTVARWTKDGTPDSSFGVTGPGYTNTAVGGPDSGASSLAFGPGNTIIAGGYSGDSFAIARYISH